MPLLLTSFARSIPRGLPSGRAEANLDPATLNKGASRSEDPPCKQVLLPATRQSSFGGVGLTS
jgi:hypothetical protein